MTKKTTLYGLAMAIVLTTILFSCKKADPGKDPNEPPVIVKNPPAAPTLSAAFTQIRPWMGGADTCKFSTEAGAVVTMNGSNEVSNPLYFPNVTSPISFRLSATKTLNGLTSSPTVQDMYTEPYSQDTTDRCANLTLNGYGVWSSNTLQSLNGGLTWTPGPQDPFDWIYYPNGVRKAVGAGTSSYQVTYVLNFLVIETYINLGDVGNQANLYKQESLSSTSMVLSKTAGGTMFRMFCTKH